MQTPLYVRPLLADERATLEAGLRAASAFTVRRCQVLLASAEGQTTTTIAQHLRCTEQTVRNVLHAFHQRGVAALQPQSSRPHTIATIFDPDTCEALRALVHQSPRTFGKPTSRWPLALAAEVSFAQGLTPRLVSDEAIRVALHRLGVSWQRAKHWITSPDPAYARKKNGATDSSSGLTPSRRGRLGLATKSGGAGWPSPTNTAGLTQRSPSSSRS